jgi:hypothetical protein
MREEQLRLLTEQREHDPELTLKPKINDSIVVCCYLLSVLSLSHLSFIFL